MMKNFSGKLISWYHDKKRDLPWRNTKNPYFIWLSEIILQQTRVDQGLPYYYKFTETFPRIEDLANASQDEVLRLWQGLGYYSRGRNLHYTAQQIVRDFNGHFPTSYPELLKLKGVGSYTAAAISSFCGNENNAVVDGNVYRVLSRYFGVASDISLTSIQKEFQHLANTLLDKKNPGLHNQAIMEFGALQCVPKKPQCEICPLNVSCYAFSQNKIDVLPYKSKKIKIKTRFFNYLVIKNNDSTIVRRRLAGDVWEGLYEFPLIETEHEIDDLTLFNSKEFNMFISSNKYKITSISKQFKHQLTHQTIFCKFFEIKVSSLTNINGFESVLWSDLDNYPKPILIQRFYINK
jgi:A/G-specific adenine glycosylase